MFASSQLHPINLQPQAAIPPKGRLLIVDDDDIFLRAMNQACSREGYRVMSWNPHNRGWDIPEELGFEVIVMDFQLGALKGTQLAAMIRNTPIILVSSSSPPADDYWPSSIMSFETKYRGIPYLVRAVDKMCQKWAGGTL